MGAHHLLAALAISSLLPQPSGLQTLQGQPKRQPPELVAGQESGKWSGRLGGGRRWCQCQSGTNRLARWWAPTVCTGGRVFERRVVSS